MNDRTTLDLSIAAWLDEEARDGAPERLIDATRRQLEDTNQRRVVWPAWRPSPMNMRFVVAAAVIVIAVVGGYLILPQMTGPGAQPSPSDAPTPAPTPQRAPAEQFLDTGRYFLRPYGSTAPQLEIAFTLPEIRWKVFGDWALLSPNLTGAPNGSGLAFLSTSSLYSDPCHWDTTGSPTGLGDVPVGPTAADLANAIHAQTAYTSTAPVDVTIDGYPGKSLDVELPSDIDFATECDTGSGNSEGSYWMWSALEGEGNNITAQGPGERRHISIVDVEGKRLILLHNDYAGTSEADQAAAQAVFDSIEITP